MTKQFSLAILILGATLVGGGLQHTLAAPFSGKGLTISPPNKDFTIKPGDTVQEVIKLTNPTDQIQEAYPEVLDFKARGDTGEPSFYAAAKDGGDRYALSSWISFSQPKVALAPGQVASFNYTVTIPANAEPGGHYGAVFFANQPPKPDESASQVAITSKVGTLILIKVPGDIKEEGTLLGFAVDKFFHTALPVGFTYRLNNQGNIHFRPHGEIIIKDWHNQFVTSVPINVQQGSVLPESNRRFDEKWNPDKLPIGYYKATLAVLYGEPTKNLTGPEVTFMIVPVWLIASILGTLVVLTLIILLIIMLVKANRAARIRH